MLAKKIINKLNQVKDPTMGLYNLLNANQESLI